MFLVPVLELVQIHLLLGFPYWCFRGQLSQIKSVFSGLFSFQTLLVLSFLPSRVNTFFWIPCSGFSGSPGEPMVFSLPALWKTVMVPSTQPTSFPLFPHPVPKFLNFLSDNSLPKLSVFSFCCCFTSITFKQGSKSCLGWAPGVRFQMLPNDYWKDFREIWPFSLCTKLNEAVASCIWIAASFVGSSKK